MKENAYSFQTYFKTLNGSVCLRTHFTCWSTIFCYCTLSVWLCYTCAPELPLERDTQILLYI